MWFTFALLSTLFAGLHTFLLKVAVEKRYDTYLINALGAAVSFLGALTFFTYTSSWALVPSSLYVLGGISGVLFIVYSVVRMEALGVMDAALLFPLSKVLGPLVAAGIGITILSEQVSVQELLGIALSCAVPLLLISRHENKRQKNLKLGLILMVVSTALATVSSAVNTYAVKPDSRYALPLLIIAHGCAFMFALGLFLKKHKVADMFQGCVLQCTRPFLVLGVTMGIIQFLSFYTMLLAFAGSNLSLVYSINAHYIVIPVLLSVWFYKEHWNIQKALALIVSLFALILLHH